MPPATQAAETAADLAQQCAPCVLLLRGIDAVGRGEGAAAEAAAGRLASFLQVRTCSVCLTH